MNNRPPSTRGEIIIAVLTVVILLTYATSDYFLWQQGKASETAAKAAESAADTAKQALTIDQRAWLGPTEFGGLKPPGPYIKEGSGLVAIVVNSGKSPALKVRPIVNMRVLRTGEAFEATYPPAKSGEPISVGVVQPQTKITLASKGERPITSTDIKNIQSGDSVMYFFGKLTYWDVSMQSERHTTFCMTLNRALTVLSACDTYNDED
jgi:type II secretory pathway pseudopilin PulG